MMAAIDIPKRLVMVPFVMMKTATVTDLRNCFRRVPRLDRGRRSRRDNQTWARFRPARASGETSTGPFRCGKISAPRQRELWADRVLRTAEVRAMRNAELGGEAVSVASKGQRRASRKDHGWPVRNF